VSDLERSRSETAHTARTLLAPALADLEGIAAPPSCATRALEHTAHAMSALYAAETEAATEEAARANLRKALDALTQALDALHELPDRRGALDRAASAVAHALAFLYPSITAAERKRREVLSPGVVANSDDKALRALAGSGAVPVASPVPSVAPERTSVSPEREQRTAERAHVEVDVGLLSDSNFYTGFSGDISEGGVFVATETRLATGTSVTLYFVLPGGRAVRAEGHVRWARTAEDGRVSGMGVGFAELRPSDRAAIIEYCATRPPLFHE
jgi:uncharacterized protein (TIGR02266 family)